ncbi:MAG: hypothetical protein QOE68_4237 [Thermoanaerobaculia bacterium]|jgi:hypothetical protein|nr:hypothetical protein [Thermoanaerobaculia bacterium]
MTDWPGFDQRLFGLRVRSTHPIPFALSSGEGPPDVIATFGSLPEWLVGTAIEPSLLERDESPYALSRAGESYVLDYVDGTRIVVTRGAIWMTWRDPLNFDDACTYLVGPAFALLLRLRGAACVHASAISIGDRAIAIVGPSGSGKSTIAAALVLRGAMLIAEDVLPLTMRGGRILAVPAYAGIRLWPEAVALLMQSRDALPGISPTWDKRVLEVDVSQCAGTPQPLSAIVFLEDRDASLTPAEGAMRLVANSYRSEMLDAEMRRREFSLFSDLAATIPLFSIRATHDRDPDILASLCTTSSITAG